MQNGEIWRHLQNMIQASLALQRTSAVILTCPLCIHYTVVERAILRRGYPCYFGLVFCICMYMFKTAFTSTCVYSAVGMKAENTKQHFFVCRLARVRVVLGPIIFFVAFYIVDVYCLFVYFNFLNIMGFLGFIDLFFWTFYCNIDISMSQINQYKIFQTYHSSSVSLAVSVPLSLSSSSLLSSARLITKLSILASITTSLDW